MAERFAYGRDEPEDVVAVVRTAVAEALFLRRRNKWRTIPRSF